MPKTNKEILEMLVKEIDEKGLSVSAEGFIGGGIGKLSKKLLSKLGNLGKKSKEVKKFSEFSLKDPKVRKILKEWKEASSPAKEVNVYPERVMKIKKKFIPKELREASLSDELLDIKTSAQAKAFGKKCSKDQYLDLLDSIKRIKQQESLYGMIHKKSKEGSYYLGSAVLRKKTALLKEAVKQYEGK